MPGTRRTDVARVSAVEFLLLGPLGVNIDGVLVPLGPPKQRALLAHLLVRANQAVPVGRLVDELWPESPPESAEHAVAVYVSRLRKTLGDPARLPSRQRAFEVRVEPDEVDLVRFRSLVSEARERLDEEPAEAVERLREAMGLWRGRALADLDGEPGVRGLVHELEEERLAAHELRIEAELRLGQHGRLVPELERLLAEHPAREAFYRQLMLALYRSGRHADALEIYRRARANLRRELGVEPSRDLRELEAAVLRQDAALGFEPAELRTRLHLPVRPEPLAGHEHEVSELAELVASGGVRLVTVTGQASARKTWLAIAAAERLAGSFRDGVWYVSVGEAGIAGVAGTLEVHEAELEKHLRGKELLLVLDRTEHLPPTAISDLLRQAPRVKLLVLAPARLRLYGEHEYRAPSGPPDGDATARPG